MQKTCFLWMILTFLVSLTLSSATFSESSGPRFSQFTTELKEICSALKAKGYEEPFLSKYINCDLDKVQKGDISENPSSIISTSASVVFRPIPIAIFIASVLIGRGFLHLKRQIQDTRASYQGWDPTEMPE